MSLPRLRAAYKRRPIAALWMLGASLVILPVCMLGVTWLLAKGGIIDTWTGILLSFIGLRLLQALAVIGVSLALTAVILRQKNRHASRHSRIVLWTAVVALFLFTCVLMACLRRILIAADEVPPLELWHSKVVLGAEQFSREVAYRLPGIGVVTDLQQDINDQLIIAGRRGAALVRPDGMPVGTIRFEECRSNVVVVKGTKNDGPYYLCRGDWIEDPRLLNSSGELMWSLGIPGDGVNDSAGGDLGDSLAVAVGYNGGTGVRLVDPIRLGGNELWSQRDDGNIWHIEIASSEKYPDVFIVHSNARGELVIRNKNGVVLSRHKPAIYLAKFSLTDWGADSHFDKLVASDKTGLYVLEADGSILARFPIDREADITDINASMLHAGDGSPYFAVIQAYGRWHRSRLRIFDKRNVPIYEEVLGDDCASMRAIPDHRGFQTLLLGCNGMVYSYRTRQDAK
jgi:hypothetical protein